MLEKQTVEVKSWFDPDYPIVMYFLPSGCPDTFIFVSEQPHGVACRHVSKQEMLDMEAPHDNREDI